MPHKKITKVLLSKGYFPRELPNNFSTSDFGSNINEILPEWERAKVFQILDAGKVPGGRKNKRDSYTYKVDNSELEVISKPKRGYERRNIHITHPVPQSLLSLEMAKNWKSIQNWLSRQTYSIDEIRLSDNFRRGIKQIDFDIHRAKKGHIEAISDWLIKTDISRFYPSIYTHSIPWAAYGKERVKKNLRLYGGSFADRLDALVRACNRNQTIGIPVGPETSRIIAEIISSSIDTEFKSKHRELKDTYVDRLQDDWFVGVDSFETAERVLSSLTAIYRGYGLEINGGKTSVNRVIAETGTRWVSEIAAFISHRSGVVKGPRLREFLALSLRLQGDFPSDPVVSYSLAILESQNIDLLDVELVEAFLLKAAIIAPISMDRICRVVLNLQFKSQRISRQRIGLRFCELAERNMKNGNTYEVMWLLYTLRGLRIPLDSKYICSAVEDSTSSVLSLILLDMDSKKLCARALPKQIWVEKNDADKVLTDNSWLLMYEGIRNGWLTDQKSLMAEPFFSAMLTRNVKFYDQTRNVSSSAKVTNKSLAERRKSALNVIKFMTQLRGLPDDY